MLVREKISHAKHAIFAFREKLRLAISTPIYQFAYFAELFGLPPLLHSSALICSSTSALSASSAVISCMISFGLRCVTSSPAFGFLTERSQVPLLALGIWTVQ